MGINIIGNGIINVILLLIMNIPTSTFFYLFCHNFVLNYLVIINRSLSVWAQKNFDTRKRLCEGMFGEIRIKTRLMVHSLIRMGLKIHSDENISR